MTTSIPIHKQTWTVVGLQKDNPCHNPMRHVYSQEDREDGGTGCVVSVPDGDQLAFHIAAVPDLIRAIKFAKAVMSQSAWIACRSEGSIVGSDIEVIERVFDRTLHKTTNP